MPLYDFVCACGARMVDEFFPYAGSAPMVLPCSCGREAARKAVYRQRVIGPVWSQCDALETALFSPKQRALGARIRGARDMEAHDRMVSETKGLRRIDPDSAEARGLRDEMRDEVRTYDRVRGEGGAAAVDAFTTKQDVIAATGWDSTTYSAWKDATDAVERAVADGTIQPDAAPSPA